MKGESWLDKPWDEVPTWAKWAMALGAVAFFVGMLLLNRALLRWMLS